MLHYEPVLNEDGTPVYESENIVKLKRNVLPEVTSYFDGILITFELQPTWALTLKGHFEALENNKKINDYRTVV